MNGANTLSVSASPTFHLLTEERILKIWQETDIYAQFARRAGLPHYILREMPTAIHHFKLDMLKGKIQQDVFLKVNMMRGAGVEYVPHWDYYTSAVERKALNSEHRKGTFDALRFRRQCRREFQHEVARRWQQLHALGIFGDWKSSSKNLEVRDEAKIINVFSRLWALGYLDKDRKLGCWCQKCNTILDEDEIEIRPAQAYSGYVKFPVSIGLEEFGEDVYFLVWLQDLWHLAGSVAIGLKENSQYLIVELGSAVLVLAEEDLSTRFPAGLRTGINLLDTCRVDVLTGCTCAHPFLGTDLPVVAVPDFSQPDGVLNAETMFSPPTGVVHLTPGHHPYDYQVAQTLQLPAPSVIDDTGHLTQNSEQFCGLEISEVGKFIAFELEKRGYLVYAGHEEVQQPHCWMCDTPTLFRPVQQWSFSLDSNHLRQRVLDSGDYWAHYSPEDRDWIQQTIRDLSDPCVSSRRGWGAPIPIFQCEKCGCQLSDPRIFKAICALVGRRGPNIWFKLNAEDLLPPNTLCPNCDAKEFRKEFTLLDGRFAVLVNAINNSEVKGNNSQPVNVYFFHPNQFHKWFSQFILTSIAIHDATPLNMELTSVGSNVQSAEVSENWIDKYPKDVLRLLGIHPDFDHPSMEAPIQQCQNEYNTVKRLYAEILSYLENFNPDAHKRALETLFPLDALALSVTNRVLQSVDLAYQQRHFHQAWCVLRDFCQSDLQQFYLPVLKNRFNAAKATREARSGQTALWELSRVLIQRFAPIIPFFAEQTHALIQRRDTASSSSDGVKGECEFEFSSVFLKDWVSQINAPHIADADARWKELLGDWMNERIKT